MFEMLQEKNLDKGRVTRTPARSRCTALGRGRAAGETAFASAHPLLAADPGPALLPSGNRGGKGSQAPSCQSNQPAFLEQGAFRKAARHSSAAGGPGLGCGSRRAHMPPGGTLLSDKCHTLTQLTPVLNRGDLGHVTADTLCSIHRQPVMHPSHWPCPCVCIRCSGNKRGPPELIMGCPLPAYTKQKDCAL